MPGVNAFLRRPRVSAPISLSSLLTPSRSRSLPFFPYLRFGQLVKKQELKLSLISAQLEEAQETDKDVMSSTLIVEGKVMSFEIEELKLRLRERESEVGDPINSRCIRFTPHLGLSDDPTAVHQLIDSSQAHPFLEHREHIPCACNTSRAFVPHPATLKSRRAGCSVRATARHNKSGSIRG